MATPERCPCAKCHAERHQRANRLREIADELRLYGVPADTILTVRTVADELVAPEPRRGA